MKKPIKLIPIVTGASLLVGLAVWIISGIFYAGTTAGPDLVEAVKSGSVTAASISSIEIVEPAVGHTPFTAKEYASLARKKQIDSPESIERFVANISRFQPRYVDQNHPSESHHVYLRVNDAKGFYWLYGSVLQDHERTIFQMDANTLDAVNPNGGDTYHLEDFSELLALLQQKKSIEPKAVPDHH
ncbi:MAG: hypothetical protein V4584_14490 [Verrucomicrobiota bacterium]